MSFSDQPRLGHIGLVFRWGMVLLCGGFLAWQIIVVNMSQQLLRSGKPESIELALALAPENPNALSAQAAVLHDTDPAEAEALLLRAIRLAPGSGRMMVELGGFLENRGESERADQMMFLANKLASRNSQVQVELAKYSARHNRPEEFLRHLVAVLDLNYELWSAVYPVFLAVVDNPAYGQLVRAVFSEALADRNPFWWRPFFNYASQRAKNLDTVRLLYSIRMGSYMPPGDDERSKFLARLQRDDQWLELYFNWLNSLDDERLIAMGNIFNGSFSLELMNEGFGWRYGETAGVDIGVAAVKGASDSRALRVRYSGRRAQSASVYQFLKLPPGRYEFSGRVRSIAIDQGQGASWRIDCIAPKPSSVTAGTYFSGTEPWRVFVYFLEIPRESCDVQRLHLVQESVATEGRRTRGILWFDDFVIRNLD